MEQHEEEKTLKTSGRKRRRKLSSSMSKPNSSLPLDLVSEILLKMPAKSIVRYRCVSKLWSSITTDQYFIKSFETQSSPKPSLLMFFRYLDKLFAFSFPQHHHQNSNEPRQSYRYSQVLDRYQIKYPKYIRFPCMESVHGLICFRNTASDIEIPIIWNPSMRQFLALPRLEKKGMTVFLGYDPIEGNHKVVCMPKDEFCDECWVLTLGSSSSSSAQESYWRKIKTNLYHQPFPFKYKHWQCINGVLYYKAYLDHKQHQVIMSFDVRSETFQPITLPLDTMCELLITYEGRLASVHVDYMLNGKGIKMWVLEDAEKHEWSDKFFLTPFSHSSFGNTFKLTGVTDGGEFIFVPSAFHNLFCILYFDPKRDSIRNVVFEGIADEKFRLSNGLGNSPIYELQAFPNHIESLISL